MTDSDVRSRLESDQCFSYLFSYWKSGFLTEPHLFRKRLAYTYLDHAHVENDVLNTTCPLTAIALVTTGMDKSIFLTDLYVMICR